MSRNYRPSYAPSVGQPLSRPSVGQALPRASAMSSGSRASGSGVGFGSGSGSGSGSDSGSGVMRSARESMFPVPSGEYINSLEECVKATEGCVSSMSSTLDKLEPAIADFPRLSRIFEIQYGYLLIPEPRITAAKNGYAASQQPRIDQLLQRAADLVAEESVAVARMEEQLSLLENARASRLPAAPRLPGTFKDLDVDPDRRYLDGLDVKGMSIAQRRKVELLKRRRDKYDKELARLRGQ